MTLCEPVYFDLPRRQSTLSNETIRQAHRVLRGCFEMISARHNGGYTPLLTETHDIQAAWIKVPLGFGALLSLLSGLLLTRE